MVPVIISALGETAARSWLATSAWCIVSPSSFSGQLAAVVPNHGTQLLVRARPLSG